MWLTSLAGALSIGLFGPNPQAPGPEAPPQGASAPSTNDERLAIPALPDLRFRLGVDLPIFVGATAVWGTTEALKSRLAPRECRWCDQDLNGFDQGARAFKWRRQEAAATTSDIVVYGGIPLLMFGLQAGAWTQDRAWRVWWEDLIFVWETVAVSAALTQGIKMSAARRRPFVRYQTAPSTFEDTSGINLSFVSGHTSLAFSLVVATGTVSKLRGYRMTPVIFGVGLPLASLGGYLRIAGDRHYLSDVLAGAAMASALGVGMPLLLHKPRKVEWRAQVLPFPGGGQLAMQF